MRRTNSVILLLCLLLITTGAQAGFFDDAGYNRLKAELGANLPKGTGVTVAQVEAPTDNLPSDGISTLSWIPDPTDSQLTSKIFDEISTGSDGFSNHATIVGKGFYGSLNSLSPDIININLYEVNSWLSTDFLNTGSAAEPDKLSTRIANHSWAGSAATDAGNIDILRRLDFVVDADEFIQAVSMTNNSSNYLLSGSFNAIVVGLSKGGQTGTRTFSGSVYTGDRTRPDIVLPIGYLSGAVPRLASASALLVSFGHANPSLSTDPLGISTNNRIGDTIYNAERSEVIKAVLMTGADRNTLGNTGPAAPNNVDITDYRLLASNQTSNGLDKRFGAGQLNIYNSYYIMAAGEQNSAEDKPTTAGAILNSGFDYDPAFGGQGGSNTTASYVFSTNANLGQKLKASLVWNLNVPNLQVSNSDTLSNLGLQLIDVTGGSATPVASSNSSIDNTENIWFDLLSNRTYKLQVIRDSGATFNWDYALAWQVSSLPVVDANQLFSIDENSSSLTPVNTVTATVSTGAVTNYSIINGNEGDAFSINSSGELTVAGNIDYETITSYSLGIVVTDGLNISDSEIVVVDVNNLNDVAPVVDLSQIFYIDENSINGTSVETVSASDVDSAVTDFTIEGGSAIFAIDSNGLITVSGAINYESITSYTLSIIATDGINTSAAVGVTVEVNNLDEIAPVVTSGQNFNINENSVNTTVVGTVTAIDAADAGGVVNGFNIVSGNTGNVFAIDSNGVITVAGAIDHEITTSYTLGITATDDSANVSNAVNVVIDVNDLNDVAPVVASLQIFNIDENSVNGASVGTVSASDVDSAVTGFTIVGGSAIFAIDSKGFITVSGVINYENITSYTLPVIATDGVNFSNAVDVTINVNNLDDTPPTVTPLQSFSIDENSVNTTVVGTVTATDAADASGVVSSFNIVNGNTANAFAISSNGVITVEGTIDYETTTSYTLSVTASDDSNNISNAVDVVVDVTNLNDTAPVIGASQSFNIDENSDIGTVPGVVLATDVDSTITGFSIVSGNTDNVFAIDVNGEITLSAPIDYETTTSYKLSITASDSVNTSSIVSVDIAVNNINESAGGGGGGGGSLNLLWLIMPFFITVCRRRVLH